MNYDNDLGYKHSIFNSVFGPEGSISYWNNFGIPISKIAIGIPFLGEQDGGKNTYLTRILFIYSLILTKILTLLCITKII